MSDDNQSSNPYGDERKDPTPEQGGAQPAQTPWEQSGQQQYQQTFNSGDSSRSSEPQPWQPQEEQTQPQPQQLDPNQNQTGAVPQNPAGQNAAQQVPNPYQQFPAQGAAAQPDQQTFPQQGGAQIPPQLPTQGAPYGVPYGAPYGAPGSLPNQPSKKKTPVGLIIGIVVAAVVVVAVVIAVVFGGKLSSAFAPLKSSDYNDGLNQTSTMAQRYSRVTSEVSDVYSGASGTTKIDDDDVAKLKEYIKKYEEDNAAFGALKVASAEDVKKAYDAYLAKSKKFVAFSTNLADSAVALSAVSASCSKTPTASTYDNDFYTEYESYINACKADLDKLGDAPDQAIAKYGKGLGDYIGSLSGYIEKMKALGNPDSLEYGTDQYNQFQDLLDEFYDIGSPYDVVSELQQALTDEEKDADPSDALKDLSDVLQDGFTDKLS